MPYDFNWHDEAETIVRLDVRGEVTWDEWHRAIDIICNHSATKSHRIDIIIHDRVGMPQGNPIAHLKASTLQLREHKNIALILTVTSPSQSFLIHNILNTVMRIMRISGSSEEHFFDKLEDALRFIEKDRAKQNQPTSLS